ncbi:MAG: aminotransferase class I/II-fold pyridoxal phosphate-dependent enzyme [Candidatus Hodarchaeales archaeon]|jgi:aspartate/methionine/tyrosine aminotransferase
MSDKSNSSTRDISSFGYSGILTELEKLARKRTSYLHLSNCDPPIYGYNLESSIVKKIDSLQISSYTGYPTWNGDEELRKSLTIRIKDICKANIPTERIIMTNGVSECFPLTFAALFHSRPGSIAIPDPSYIPLMVQARRFGDVWFYPCDEEDYWNPDIDKLIRLLKVHRDTKAILIITPNSPTGAVYSEKVLKEIINIAGQYNLIVITDEIYDTLTFSGFQSPLKYANEVPVIYLNGFSKVYRLPGYRLGYLGWYDPEEKYSEIWDYLEQLCRAKFGVSLLAQEVAKLALQEPEKQLRKFVTSVEKKHLLLNRKLSSLENISVVPAGGATYVFPKINVDVEDERLAKYMLQKYGILVSPGSAYGPSVAPGHLRFVTLAPEDDLLKGIQALELSLAELTPGE